MAYENGKLYWFISHRGTGKALSVYGNSDISQNRNVIIWDKQSINDQKWMLEVFPGYARIKSSLGPNYSYALNIWTGSSNKNNCDVRTWTDNTEDSKVDFLTVDASQNLYKIKLLNYNLVMTAKGAANGSDVRWEASTGNNDQIWQLVEFGGITPPSGGYTYPTAYRGLSQGYSYNHPALDIRDRHATDHNIYAFADGVVSSTQTSNNPLIDWTMGNCIAINHNNPDTSIKPGSYMRTIYMHMKDAPLLKAGDRVSKGQVIGIIGNTGNSGGNHLHFSLSCGNSAAMKPGATGWIKIIDLPDFDPRTAYLTEYKLDPDFN